MSLAKEVSGLLKDRFGVRRVVLFGSLAHVSWFTRSSDIDLAVEGLTGEDYWEAWKLAEGIFRDRRVDFVEIETTTESVKQAINRHGIEL
ncbi:MAG: nucleotidyltransferase domain-containing protein [Desulfobacterales bacterium]|nr:nucleotidyltransferase domain-containing protein [Desulfobacterales bacterium]